MKDKYVPEGDRVTVKAWITGLEAPWSLVFLPDGRALVSERPGRIRLIRDGALVSNPYAAPDVAAVGEGGLMGLAVHPKFPNEPVHLCDVYVPGKRRALQQGRTVQR